MEKLNSIDNYTQLYTLPNNVLEDANVYKRNHDDQLVIIKHFKISDTDEKKNEENETEISIY
jgi:hypothetical protein